MRELADSNFNVAVLRPPMVYGKGAKGNYQTLAKMVGKLPIFPDLKNMRSMLYIENLCEFVAQLTCSGEGGIYFPQNGSYSNTVALVKMIGEATGKQVKVTRLLNPIVGLASRVPGKISGSVNKAFGNFIYSQRLSSYVSIDYQGIDLNTSIVLTHRK